MNQKNNDDFVLAAVTVAGSAESSGKSSALRLDRMNLTVSPGEWITIVGVNGSGKTTLARIMAGLTVEEAGGYMNRGFAGDRPAPYVMQQPDAQLFGETPREEITFALEWLQLPAADIPVKTDAILMLSGLQSIAYFPWANLSGGQRQLAAIAAATAGNAPLIVFDEATSMLDDRSRERVYHIAKELNAAGSSVVWVTQRLDELESSSRVIALAEGRIIFDGSSEHFLYGEPTPSLPSAMSSSTPCEQCGLRLPYLASLAMELKRLGQLQSPLPITVEEWRRALNVG
ncbi:energy-coupling factor transporter ATP-binding protein EcfA [Paenibacillus baekrokdamisoli]|uniref:Energy-coupling factor transporter ATP-binding protein EcfA n=1 Tax=Paenibacillus baekrokdamisoli TaxID=1712516 RepID=A0A3G9IQS5_9BACL|nr:ATP-binding cassette domain-containing protein [Paenibacillus baekrokdamisoli]MBB3069910.1 energy-coupling factor transporter ATP-binding protein EcfA2 [Paenibacillus baekrokdamisoli]BBH20736.1 energy-coupling factor transporter ATP-binding protein EcfA [Paenibacillus baekrokdamisoli]